MHSVPERDWKKLKALKEKKMSAACERIFKNVQSIIDGRTGRTHEAYLELWNFLDNEDRQFSQMFDDLKRSNALVKLIAWRENSLLSDAELAQFSEETQGRLRDLDHS